MTFGSRLTVLAAAIALPLGAALATYALAGAAPAPDVPGHVRIGESGGPQPASPTTSTAPPTTGGPNGTTPAPSAATPGPGQPPRTQVVPPPPPVSDDDDDDDDRGGGDDDGADDD